MKPRIRTVALLISATALAAAAAFVPAKTASAHIRASSCPWLNESLPIKQRVQELVSAMTLPQMFTEMHAIRATTGVTGRFIWRGVDEQRSRSLVMGVGPRWEPRRWR
jgi:hypothetical protein